MTRSVLILVLASPLLAVGCQSDVGIHLVPGDPPINEGDPLTGPEGPEPPSWPFDPPEPIRPPELDPPEGDPPEDPPGWGNWNPGDIPELYFAVAWSEWDCNGDVDGDGSDPGPGEGPEEGEPPDNDSIIDEDSDGWYGCPVRLAVIDLLGQVIAEFPLPGEQDTWTPNYHLSLAPAGPGQFLSTVERYEDVDGDDDASNADGFWQGNWWHSYRGDAYTGELSLVAEWDPNEALMSIPGIGRLVDIGGYSGWANLAISPAKPDRLMVWSGDTNCGGLRELRSIYLPDANVLDDVYLPEDLLPEGFEVDATSLWPWNLDASVDEEGNTSLLLGVSNSYCWAAETVYELVAFSPDDGPVWNVPAMGLSWPPAASWAGHDGGAALELTGGTWSVEQTWRVTTPNATAEGVFAYADGIYGRRVGPMLDGAGPTFMTMALESNAEHYRNILEIHHEGAVVWTIDTLRFGLQEENVFFADVVMLPPIPEP